MNQTHNHFSVFWVTAMWNAIYLSRRALKFFLLIFLEFDISMDNKSAREKYIIYGIEEMQRSSFQART
jgi:hypothetical protein